MRSTIAHMPARQRNPRLVLGGVVLLAAGAATVIDQIIARIAAPLVHAPATYPSFSWLPIVTGCLLGAIGGYSCFLLLKRAVARPKAVFLRVAAGVLILSYGLPILPIVNPLPRFAGVNWGIAVTLMVMHTMTAVLIVGSILLWAPVPSHEQDAAGEEA